MALPVFVDTAFLVAPANRHDVYHTKAVELSLKFENQPLVLTDAVLLEVGNSLARGFRAEAVRLIDDLLASEEVDLVRLSPVLFGQAFGLYREHQDKQWGLVDCVSFVVMRERSLRQALTCDQHFRQAGFEALMIEDSTSSSQILG